MCRSRFEEPAAVLNPSYACALLLQDILGRKVSAKRELQEAFGLLVGQEYMVLSFLGGWVSLNCITPALRVVMP
jgi:hypothetical protein